MLDEIEAVIAQFDTECPNAITSRLDSGIAREVAHEIMIRMIDYLEEGDHYEAAAYLGLCFND